MSKLGYLRRSRRDTLEVKLFSHPLLYLDPYLLEYLVGIKSAVLDLQQSLKLGRYKKYLQWDITQSYSLDCGKFVVMVSLYLVDTHWLV